MGHSTRATGFMVPKSPASRIIRDTILDAAAPDPFARRLVNAGRLSPPCHCRDTPLSTQDARAWPAKAPAPGDPAIDLPLPGPRGQTRLLQQLGGDFVLMGDSATLADAGCRAGARLLPLDTARPRHARVLARHGLCAGRAMLFRPDRHVAARLGAATPGAVAAARARATGRAA